MDRPGQAPPRSRSIDSVPKRSGRPEGHSIGEVPTGGSPPLGPALERISGLRRRDPAAFAITTASTPGIAFNGREGFAEELSQHANHAGAGKKRRRHDSFARESGVEAPEISGPTKAAPARGKAQWRPATTMTDASRVRRERPSFRRSLFTPPGATNNAEQTAPGPATASFGAKEDDGVGTDLIDGLSECQREERPFRRPRGRIRSPPAAAKGFLGDEPSDDVPAEARRAISRWRASARPSRTCDAGAGGDQQKRGGGAGTARPGRTSRTSAGESDGVHHRRSHSSRGLLAASLVATPRICPSAAAATPPPSDDLQGRRADSGTPADQRRQFCASQRRRFQLRGELKPGGMTRCEAPSSRIRRPRIAGSPA